MKEGGKGHQDKIGRKGGKRKRGGARRKTESDESVTSQTPSFHICLYTWRGVGSGTGIQNEEAWYRVRNLYASLQQDL